MNSFNRDNSLSVSQSISFPTVYINQSKLASEKIKSSEWQMKGSKLETATMVKQVYWQLVYLYSRKNLLIYQDSLFTGLLRAAELRAKAGETNRLKMITARSQSLDVKNQLRQAIADINIFSLKMQALLNSNIPFYPADISVRRAIYVPPTDSSAVSENPNLGLMKQMVQVSRSEKKVALSNIMPDLNIGYFSQTILGTQDVNGVPRVFGAGDRFTGIQAGIAVPLWIVPYASKARAAKINETIAQTNADYYSKSLSGNYNELLEEYSKYSSSLEYYEKQALPEAELIIDQSARSFNAGALDYLDYVQSLGRALAIRQGYLDAANDYNHTIINIEYITGKIF